MTELSGAVVASGSLVVDTNVKKVQHPTGGVVGELRVRDGVHANAGDVVIRLDETITRANLAIVIKGIDELTARQVRLEAERDDESELHFPNELTSRMDNPDVSRVVNGERKLFDLRRSARAGQSWRPRGSDVPPLLARADAVIEYEVFHPGAFTNCSSCLSVSASSGLVELLQRGSVLCRAPIIARVTGSGAQPWLDSHTRSHCAAAGA